MQTVCFLHAVYSYSQGQNARLFPLLHQLSHQPEEAAGWRHMGQLVTVAGVAGQEPAVRAWWKPVAVRVNLKAAVMVNWRPAGRVVKKMLGVKDELTLSGRVKKLVASGMQWVAAVWTDWWRSAVHHQAFA